MEYLTDCGNTCPLNTDPLYTLPLYTLPSLFTTSPCTRPLNTLPLRHHRDPAQRPTAKQALQHPWLFCEETMLPSKPISHTVVQRIQRYCQGNMVRRSILELIATELLELLRTAEPSVHGGRYVVCECWGCVGCAHVGFMV